MNDLQSIINNWLREARSHGESDDYRARRGELRHLWPAPLELQVGGKVIIARGRELSRHGVGFVCKELLTVRSQIGVRRAGEEQWIPIRVEHCTQTISGFKVGASFQVPGDQRNGERIAADQLEAHVCFAGSDEEMPVRLIDISPTGAAFAYQEPVNEGQRLRLRVACDSEAVEVQATVIRGPSYEDPCPAVAVQFDRRVDLPRWFVRDSDVGRTDENASRPAVI